MVGKSSAIEQFFGLLAPYERALTQKFFRYVGRISPNGVEIIAAALTLSAKLLDVQQRKIELNDFVGEEFSLTSDKISSREFIRKLENGKLMTPIGELKLLRGKSGGNQNTDSLHFFFPSSIVSTQGQRQDRVLRIHGAGLSSRTRLDTEMLAWQFRSCDQPYNGINDLLADFGLLDQSAQLEILAFPLSYVDNTSTIIGETATLKIRTARDIDVAQVSLGYQVIANGLTVERGRIDGGEMDWQPDPAASHISVGTKKVRVPVASVLHCFANAFGVCHHHFWVGDLQAPQNVRRAIFSGFDEGLERLANLLSRPNKRGNARNVESAIAWLLWMLGFSTAHLGDTEGFSDGPDIVATTPEGDVLVIECTTGGLKNHQKMQQLLDRTAIVREQLSKSGRPYLKALPMMVTTRLLSEVQQDVDEYHKNGIVVATGDELVPELERTIRLPNASEYFQSIWGNMESRMKAIEDNKKALQDTIADLAKVKKSTRRLKAKLKSD